MKTKKHLITGYNFVLAFALAMFFGAPAMAASAIGAVATFAINQIPGTYSSAFTGFITAGSEYTGKELEEVIIRPYFLGQLPKEMGIRVINAVKSTVKLTFLNSKSKNLKGLCIRLAGWYRFNFQTKEDYSSRVQS